MSLTVTPDVLDQAERGELSQEAFVEVVRTSLPYFHKRVELLARGVEAHGLTTNDDTPTTQAEWGQLLRGFASDPIRTAMEQHFGIKLGFRNCCFAAATRPEGEKAAEWRDLFTQQAQILAQSPELMDC
jgi:hypothetical protein